jgi:DNA-binding MarR family transcriptional regulator
MAQPTPGVAFLLAQIGAAAAARFAAAIEPLGLTPPQAGLLRLLQSRGESSQQELAARLGTAPSRVVSYLDDLERRGILTREPGLDRRVNVVTLTAAGRTLLANLSSVARAHDATVTEALTASQRDQLRTYLTAIAQHLELSPGIHPGYAKQRPDGG